MMEQLDCHLKKPDVLHIMTQKNQPYGSQRRCCERCGEMIWGCNRPNYTDDWIVYDNYVRKCRP
jgi:hypothetical protein